MTPAALRLRSGLGLALLALGFLALAKPALFVAQRFHSRQLLAF